MQRPRIGADEDAVAFGRRRRVGPDACDHHLAVAQAADDVLFVSERLDHGDGRGDARAAEAQVLGPHAEDDRVDARPARALDIPSGSARSAPGTRTRSASASPTTIPATVFIGGLPMNAGDEEVRGPVVDLLRRPDLLEHAVAP